MRKSIWLLLSLLLVASMLLTACGTPAATEAPAAGGEAPAATEAPAAGGEAPAAEKTVLQVWSFTNEIRTMAVAFEGLHPDVALRRHFKLKVNLNSHDRV